MSPVIIDTYLILLLIVGLVGVHIIPAHRNLSDYTIEDYVSLSDFITMFSDIILLPHVLAEVSNLARQVNNPYKTQIQLKLRDFVELNGELLLPSLSAVRRSEFVRLGMTDAAILHALDVMHTRANCALLTVDGDLAIAGEVLGYDVYTMQALRG